MAGEASFEDSVAKTVTGHKQDVILSELIVTRKSSVDRLSKSLDITLQNFKRFHRVQPAALPGNSYEAMIPFAKDPHREATSGKDIEEVARQERKRKASEKAAEDLFNSDKLKRQKAGAPGRARPSR